MQIHSRIVKESRDLDSSLLGPELFSFLLEHTPDQIYFKDRQGRFLRVSRAVAQYMDVPRPEDLIGKSDFDFWSQQTAKEAFADEQRIIQTGEPMVGKVERLVHPDGRVTWDYTTKLPLKNSRGEIIGICGINKDFTAIRNMEDALTEERNRLAVTTAELEAKNAQLEADLRMAREVQLALLPRDYPTISAYGITGYTTLRFAHCYRPAAAVGGDFFDIFPLSKNRVGVFICDVMGHGLRAALITAIIRALLEELRPVMHNAGLFLNALNIRLRAILQRVEEPFVATAFYMIADSAMNEVHFSNAAHPPPVRLRRDEAAIEPLRSDVSSPSPALGLFDEVNYTALRSPFEGNDCIVLFTDGLYEVDSADGEEYGFDSLLSSFQRHVNLPAKKLFETLLADVQQYSSRQDFEDDVCMVAVDRSCE